MLTDSNDKKKHGVFKIGLHQLSALESYLLDLTEDILTKKVSIEPKEEGILALNHILCTCMNKVDLASKNEFFIN